MGVFALSFFAHAFETAWAVKVPAEGSDSRRMDYTKADKAARGRADGERGLGGVYQRERGHHERHRDHGQVDRCVHRFLPVET